jgi:hypothetical protein
VRRLADGSAIGGHLGYQTMRQNRLCVIITMAVWRYGLSARRGAAHQILSCALKRETILTTNGLASTGAAAHIFVNSRPDLQTLAQSAPPLRITVVRFYAVMRSLRLYAKTDASLDAWKKNFRRDTQ